MTASQPHGKPPRRRGAGARERIRRARARRSRSRGARPLPGDVRRVLPRSGSDTGRWRSRRGGWLRARRSDAHAVRTRDRHASHPLPCVVGRRSRRRGGQAVSGSARSRFSDVEGESAATPLTQAQAPALRCARTRLQVRSNPDITAPRQRSTRTSTRRTGRAVDRRRGRPARSRSQPVPRRAAVPAAAADGHS